MTVVAGWPLKQQQIIAQAAIARQMRTMLLLLITKISSMMCSIHQQAMRRCTRNYK